jgi:hypothetical protein
MHQVLFGSALLISFLGGVVALLAPCWLPGWAVLLVLAGLAAALAALAVRARRRAAGPVPGTEAGIGSDTDEIAAATVPAGRPREGSQS